jgi:hypothetical protein
VTGFLFFYNDSFFFISYDRIDFLFIKSKQSIFLAK